MADEITGRDTFIMAQALILAINTIDATEAHRREFTNRHDMMKLLLAICPSHEVWTVIANDFGIDAPPVDSPGYEEWLNAGGPKLRLVWEQPELPPSK